MSDSTMKGTCMTTSECVSKGGSADGNCASGFGVCCSFVIKGCGGAVSHVRTKPVCCVMPMGRSSILCFYFDFLELHLCSSKYSSFICFQVVTIN